MCCGFKFCVISRLYFIEFHIIYIFVKLTLYNYFWNFMVLQDSCVLTSIHMDKTVMVFHICQFENFIKLSNFTLSTFFSWNLWKIWTSWYFNEISSNLTARWGNWATLVQIPLHLFFRKWPSHKGESSPKIKTGLKSIHLGFDL
jgi:hypothetical protein